MSITRKHLLASFALSLSLLPIAVQASLLVSPHGAGRDSDLAGVVVASPNDGASSLLINPAGVVSQARDEAYLGIFPGTLKVAYSNPETGYSGFGSTDAVNLGVWYGLGEIAGWSVGVGAYGSLGAAFDLPAAPEIGQTSPYLGEFGILNFGLNIGRQITPELKVGIQLSPRYGTQETKLPSPLGDIHFEADGFGYGAAAGLVYTPTNRLSLGFAYRTKGSVKFEGDGTVGDVQQDVTVKMVSPQRVSAGLAYELTDQLTVLSQLDWTRYKDFQKSNTRFEVSTPLNGHGMSKTHNRSRWGIAMEYEVAVNHYLRFGFTSGKEMIDDEVLSPVMYDHENDMLMVGYEMDMGTWRWGLTTGVVWNKDRQISVEDNPFYPGNYKSKAPASIGIRFIKEFDRTPSGRGN